MSVRAGTEEYDEQAALQGEEKVRAAVMLAERKALAVEGTDGEPIRRKSAIVEAARVVASLTPHGVRTLCFAKTRKLQELCWATRASGRRRDWPGIEEGTRRPRDVE